MPFNRKRRKTPLILQIDDSRSILAVTKGLVTYELKCDMIQAENADDGIRMASKQQPDIILLDAIMEPKDGWTAARELQGDVTTKDIPIIMQTGKDKVADIDRAYSLGVSDYLVKPPSKAKLLRKFIKLLGKEIFIELGVDISEAFRKKTAEVAKEHPATTPPPPVNPVPAEIPVPVPCGVCGTPLTWLPPYMQWYCYTCNKYSDLQPPPPTIKRTCFCGQEMSYMFDKKCWYCFICKATMQ